MVPILGALELYDVAEMTMGSGVQQLLGRTAELGAIDAALAGVREGTGSVVMFRGDPGQGKTALLRHATEAAGELRVLSCRGVEWEAELPFSALHELLGPVFEDLWRLPDGPRSALAVALGLTDGDAPAQLSVYSAAHALVAEVARRRPLLLVVDDLQWVDSLSLNAIAFLARRLRDVPVALLVAGRMEAVLPGFEAELVDLEGLDRPAVAELAERLAGRPLPAAALDQLAAASDGNPLAVVEVVRHLGTEITQRGGLLDDPLPAGELIERAFQHQLAGQSAGAAIAAEVLAASLNDEVAVLNDAIERLGQPRTALEEAEQGGLLRIAYGRAEFVHPLLRALVHRRMSATRRRAAHAALAVVLPPAAPLRAWHAASAATEPDESIAAPLAAAAEGFGHRGGHLAAAQALTRAAALTPDPDLRAERLLAAGQAAHFSGRAQWALELLDASATAAVAERTRLAIDFERLCVETHVIGVDDLGARFQRLGERLAPVDPPLAVDAMLQAVVEASISGDNRVLEQAAAGFELIDRAALPATLAAHADSGRLYAALANGSADQRAAAEAELVALVTADPATYGEPMVGQMLVLIERFDIAEPLVARLCDALLQRGDLLRLTPTLWTRGALEYRVGEWAAAAASFEDARRIGEAGEHADSAVPIACGIALLGAARGDRTVVDDLARVEPLARKYRYGTFNEWAGSALGLLELSLGQPAAAIPHLERARDWEPVRRSVPLAYHCSWPTDLAEAYALAGRHAEAVAATGELRAFATESGRPSLLAAVARLDGILAPDDAFEAHFLESLERYPEARHPFDEARTRLAFGRRLRRARRVTDARTQLELAREAFVELAAAPWVRQVDVELGAGTQTGAGHDALTVQERQVAEVVAGGASNKEAAATLYLSPKTIEAHLSRIYRKLGVSSRTQLAARWDELSGD